MSYPELLIGTIVLNEMEWLPKLYEQHRDWPGLVRWVFVEGADAMYAKANPELVTTAGLSVDGTSVYLAQLAARDPRITYIPYGLSSHTDPAQGKVRARQKYLSVAESVEPKFVLILDADEFYIHKHQGMMSEMLAETEQMYTGMCFTQKDIWRPASIADQPLFQYWVTGGVWEMHHCHVWRWEAGMKYHTSHVWPQRANGLMMNSRMMRYDRDENHPIYIHMGYASSPDNRLAKTKYYTARGEGQTDGRNCHMECRYAHEHWQPGDALPHGARVLPYTGPIPEVFQ